MRSIDKGDEKRILDIYDQLKQLNAAPTLHRASDVLRNVDEAVDWKKYDQALRVNRDPLQGLLRMTGAGLNDAVRHTSPLLASANDEFSKLKGVERELSQGAGPTLSRASLLMRRVFSGDKSRQSMQILDNLQKITGRDYVKEAALAKFATDMFGDEHQQTLLRQQLGGAIREGRVLTGSTWPIIGPLVRGGARVLTPDTENYATALTKGHSYTLGPLGEAYDNMLDSAHGKAIIGPIADEMKQLGLSPQNAKTAAEKLLKSYLFNRLTQPQNVVSGQPPVQASQ
jgi:hypothetical protein